MAVLKICCWQLSDRFIVPCITKSPLQSCAKAMFSNSLWPITRRTIWGLPHHCHVTQLTIIQLLWDISQTEDSAEMQTALFTDSLHHTTKLGGQFAMLMSLPTPGVQLAFPLQTHCQRSLWHPSSGDYLHGVLKAGVHKAPHNVGARCMHRGLCAMN